MSINKKFLTKYNNKKSVTVCSGVSATDQQYLDDCNIDTILKRYRIGQPLPVTSRRALEGDFTGVGDFMDCLNRVNNAREEFASLPAVLRDRFGNDPVAYYKFVLDPANVDECIKLGLRERPVADVIPSEKSENPSSSSEGSSTGSST